MQHAVDPKAHEADFAPRLDVNVRRALFEGVLPQPIDDAHDMLIVGIKMSMFAQLDQLFEIACEIEVALRRVLRALHRARQVVELAQIALDVLRIAEDELDVELEDLLELLGEAPHERLAGGDRERHPIDRDRENAKTLRVRVAHRGRYRAKIDLQWIDMKIRDVKLAGEPFDQPLERHQLVGCAYRLPFLIGDRLERVLEAQRARACKLVGVDACNESIGHHQL